MGTICSATLLRRLVDLDVLDDQVASIESFGVGVRFGIFEKSEEVLGGFDRPASARNTKLLSCGQTLRQLWSLSYELETIALKPVPAKT